LIALQWAQRWKTMFLVLHFAGGCMAEQVRRWDLSMGEKQRGQGRWTRIGRELVESRYTNSFSLFLSLESMTHWRVGMAGELLKGRG